MTSTEHTDTHCTCGVELPARAIQYSMWVADPSEPKFGGRYVRRDFCSVECAHAAPRYVAPRKPRAPRRQAVAYGDWAQLAAFSGQATR